MSRRVHSAAASGPMPCTPRLVLTRAGLAMALAAGVAGCIDRGPGPKRKHIDPAYVAENLLTVAPTDLTHVVDADLGGKVVYLGNKVDRTRLVPGDKVQVRHYWKVVSAPGPQWRVFSHLRGDAGKPDFSNIDETDMRWGHPPATWKDGEIIQDVQDFALSPDWKSSKATLIVGLFPKGKHKISDRLPVLRGPALDNAVVAVTFEVDLSKAPPPVGTVVVKKATGPIAIDGSADEAAWLAGAASGDFVTAEGSGDPPGKTTARLLWDDQHLYVFASVDDPDVWSDYKVDDEPLWKSDVVELFIDADGNQRGYVELQVNPYNAKFDSWFAGNRSQPGDVSWNAGMITAVKIRGTGDNRGDRDQGWTAEIAIPWAAVRGRDAAMAVPTPPTLGARFKLNVVRVDYAAGSKNPTVHSWNKITYADFHGLDRLATVVFADAAGNVVPGVAEPGAGTGSGSGSGTGSGSGSGASSGAGAGSGSGAGGVAPGAVAPGAGSGSGTGSSAGSGSGAASLTRSGTLRTARPATPAGQPVAPATGSAGSGAGAVR